MKKPAFIIIALFFSSAIFSQKSDTNIFPIAVWLQSAGNAYQYKQAGINLFVGNTLNLQTLNQLNVDKMKVMCDQNAYALAHLSDTLIYGWIQQDEPDNAQWNDVTKTYDPCIDPAVIIERYDSIRAKDSTRPVYLNVGMGASYTIWGGRGTCWGKTNMYPVYNNGYFKGCDIASFDIYPVNYSNSPVGLWYVSKGIDSLKKWTENKKPVWCWIETTRIDSTSPRKPTITEVKSEVWMALIHGATGFGYFCHSFYPAFDEAALLHDTAMLSAVKKINLQVTSLTKVLYGPNTTGYASAGSSSAMVPIDIMTKNQNGQDYLFAVAMRSGVTTVTFTIDSGNYVEVLGEGRFIAAPEGSFKDDFSSYAVHLYKITTKKDLEFNKTIYHNISVYPNPFNEYTTLEIPSGAKGPFMLKVYNEEGKAVYPKCENDNGNITIFRSSLAPGIYFYTLVNSTESLITKGKLMISD
jgi:hypothetical protein